MCPFNGRNVITVFMLLFGSVSDADKDRNVTAVTVIVLFAESKNSGSNKEAANLKK